LMGLEITFATKWTNRYDSAPDTKRRIPFRLPQKKQVPVLRYL
jgi:hypothetical protein